MATPLPIIASNTEETAFAVLEGNEVLEKINVAILDMSRKLTSSVGYLTGAFMSFTENIKEQQAALMSKLSLAEPPTEETGGRRGGDRTRRTETDTGNFLDNVLEKGILQAAGISIMASLTSIVASTVTFFTGIVTTFKNIGKNIVKFGRLARKLFLPITLIIGAIGAVSKSWESFSNGDIWTGLEEAVTGFFNSVVTIPLDLIKDGVAWLLSKMGFDEAADVLNSFSFTEEFNKIVSKIFDGAKEAIKVITDLFSFGEEDKTALGILGKLTDLVFAPVNMAINFVSGIFGWSEEGAEPFKLQDWITTKVGEAITWVKDLFSWAGESIAAGWTNLTNFVSQKWEDIKTWISDKLEWAGDAVGAGWTNITNFVSQKWEDIKTWFTDKFSWTAITDDWTNITDFVSQKWEDIKTWFADKFSWTTITDDWSNLTNFVSQKWEDIKTWFGEKLAMAGETVDSATGFISQLVMDAWESVKQWFNDALAGIADSLPSLNDIKTSIISNLPHWMVPDKYKTPQMRAESIEQKIAETQAAIDENSWRSVGWDSDDEKAELAELFAEQTRILAEIAAERVVAGASNPIVIDNSRTVTATSGGGGGSQPIVIRESMPVGGTSPYFRGGR